MFKITVDVGPQQIEEIIDRMPMREQIKLVRRLEEKTLSQRWGSIFKSIDKRLKRFPVSERDIAQEIADYRKEKHAQGRR